MAQTTKQIETGEEWFEELGRLVNEPACCGNVIINTGPDPQNDCCGSPVPATLTDEAHAVKVGVAVFNNWQKLEALLAALVIAQNSIDAQKQALDALRAELEEARREIQERERVEGIIIRGRNELDQKLAAAESALLSVQAETLERAAKVCDERTQNTRNLYNKNGHPDYTFTFCESEKCAQAIRSLKSTGGAND